jgi:PKD repeat protein
LITVPVTINDLTINAGASVSVAPGAGLTLDGTMTNNGTFTLQSDNTGTAWLDDFTLGGTVVGNIRVQRYVPIGVAGFRQLGTPVNMPNISALQGFTPSGNPGFVIPLPDCNPNWVAYNSPYGNWIQLVENGPVQFGCYQSLYQVLTSGGMTRGRGYYMDVPGGTTLTFVGPPNTGPVNDYTATHANGAVTNGWNIVSNPYPSPLRWTLADVPPGFDAIAQVWVTSGTYQGTFQPVDPNTPGQAIAIGQAFQLRVSNPGSAVFSVSNANRTTSPPTFLFSGNEPMTLNIDVSKGGHSDLTKIRFMDDATPVYDGMFDSYKVLGNSNQPMVYSILDSKNMSINSYGSLTDVHTVPLGVKAGTAGEHTFVFGNMDQFPASTLIYLEDTETGIWQNMRADDSYSFHVPQGIHDNRFLVHFYPPVETATQDALCEVPGSVTISSASPAEWIYTLTGAQNTVVGSGTLTNGSVTVSNVAAGDYELTLTEVQSGYSVVETITVNGTSAVTAQATASSLNVEEGQEIQFTANAQHADTYDWSFGDGMTSSDMNPLHTYNTAGTYEVVLTASNSTNTCSAVSTLSVTVSEAATSSVEEVDADDVKMWNVANTVFIRFGSEWSGKTTFTLYDAAGKVVLNRQLNNAQGTVTVDCGVLAAGTYTAELSNGKKAVTHKAVMGIK